MQKNSKQLFKFNKNIVLFGIALIMVISTILTSFFMKSNNSSLLYNANSELLRARTYELFEDGDDIVEDTDGNPIDNIRFGAFFLRDIDGDGYADKIKGTCKQIGKEDTLYMELNVQTEGKLVNGKIEIGGESFNLQTALPKDNELKNNYIGNNIKTIEFNDIENGTQKMLSGIIHSGDYNYNSSKFSALGNNINKYNANNTIVLTGTYVVENLDGTTTETEIRKEIDLEIDWYGTAVAALSGTSQSRTNVGIANTETNEVKLDFYLQSEETKNELILKDNNLTAEIPLLNGYEPINVSVSGVNINYNYDQSTRKLTITKDAEIDDSGNAIKNAYSSYSVSHRYNNYNVSVKYPLEAYEVLGEGSTIELKIPVTTYYEGYNNSNTEFSNPYKSNIATATYTIRYQKPAEQNSRFSLDIGKYMYKPTSRNVISKKKPLRIYNELSTEENGDLYEVRWSVSTGTNGEYTGIIMKETPNESERLKDEFVKSDSTLDSMENLTSNIGIYFSNATNMLGDDGWIKVYDDETDNLIVTFTKFDWKEYTSGNIYYYDVPINHVRIETSNTNSLSSMTVYHIKELDDEYITENYSREEFDNLKKIKTNLVGYLGDTKIATISSTANYEAPFAIAEISINKDTISTQSTEKNEKITIKVEKNESLNQLGWVNGSFLIKVPQDIFDIEINNVSITNSNVRIISYEKFEDEGINYIKIITSNEREESYSISIDCDLTPDPRIASNTETFELYASSENAEEYYYNSQDIYDVNGNLNTTELVNKRTTNINLIAPNSLLTNQTAHNYDDIGTIVIAPKVAILDKERRFATVSVEIKNNYTSTISEVSVLGRVPFEGNKYVISGKEMGSNYSTTMTDAGISIPQELQDIATVYYSENGNASKDLSLEANGWTTEVSDFSKIKSYMIVLEDYALAIGESHIVSYEINIPEGLEYNQISYSHHAVFFSLDTAEGKYRTQTEPNKIGFMIAKQYDLEVIKYQKDTDKTLGEITFSIQEEGEDEVKTSVTGLDGKFRINGLYLDRSYTIKEIKGTSNYELNDDEIKFIGTEDNAILNVDLTTGNPKSITALQPHDGEDYKIQIQVEDEVRPKIKLIKEQQNSEEKISKVKFKITGKGLPTSGRIITTNTAGEANLSGLYIGEEYYIEETKAEGYYLSNPIKIKIENNNGNYSANILEGDIESKRTELNDYIPTICLTIENEKIPTYDLEITKIKHTTNIETSSDPTNPGAGEEVTYLQGAKFRLYKNGKELGSYTSDENGKILIQGLYAYEDEKNIDQTYVLKEVLTPDGYAKVKDITFKVSKVLGVLNYEETLEDGQDYKDYTIEDNMVKLIVEDNPSFKLIKKDADTDEVLSGVKFVLYNVDGETVPARNSKGEIIGEKETINGQEYYTFTTDSNGEITADLPEGIYKAVEIDAPEKYDLSNNEYYFGIGMNQAGRATINPLWSRKLEVSTGWSTAYDTINTQDGGYIVAGDFYSGLKLDDGTSLPGGVHLGNGTGFILKYDVYGHILWGDSWKEYSYGSHIRGVTELENGDLIVTGCYNESRTGLTMKYDKDGKNKERIGNYNSNLIEATNDGGFILISGSNRLIKYNEYYEEEFSKNINGIIIKDMKVLNNSIYIAANYTNDNINLGNNFILHKNESSEQACAIIECDYNGNTIKCKSFEASTKIEANKIEIDNNTNNIIIGCSFEGTISINNNELNNYSNADILVLNCNNLFNVNWVKQINGQENETISAITMKNNNIDIGISSSSTSLLDDEDVLIEKQSNTPVIIELSDDGKVNYATEVSKISGSNILQIYGLLQSEENNLIIVGRYDSYYARSIIAEAGISWTDPKLEDVCELNILNERKNYKILTEINEIDGIKGGFISGEDIYPYERVKYGDDSIKEIKMIPDENYEIISIKVNNEDWLFTPEADGSFTMPTFENMTEDKHIVVTYSLKNNKITINKKDSVSGDELEGAKFKLDQIEERTDPNISEIIGALTDNGTVYTVSDYDKEIAGFIDLSTDLKYVEGVSYYFVPKTNEDNSISYVPTNSKTWQEANVEGATTGVQSTTANSYIELDLSEMTGTYKVVINGYVSSQSGCDYGYATISTDANSITNPGSIPVYYLSTSRFIFISGTTANYTTPRDRESAIVLNGGQKYYLHLGYYKNASTDTGEDQFVINSIKLFETKDIQYNFEQKTIGEGENIREVYQSTNEGTYLKIANSYLPIDLTACTGKYYITVNAEISTTSGDYGYVTINKKANPAPAYSSNTTTNKRFVYLTSTQASKDYTIEIDGGYLYYLHLGYYKDDVLNTSGEDYFRVNSINISLSDSQIYHTTVSTNSYGQAITQIPFGKYQLTEINTPDDYVPVSFPAVFDQEGNELSSNGIIEFRSTEGSLHEFTIENEKYGHVIVHHYIKGTETSLADDEYLVGEQGEQYSTLPKAGLNNYELEVVSGEQVLPINQTGIYTHDDIEVIYYYVQKKVPLTVNHFIEGTNIGVPLKDGTVAESTITYGDINQEYETNAISNDLLDDRYELTELPENSSGIYSEGEITVNYYYKELERELIINKTENDNTTPLPNAIFKVKNQNSSVFGDITKNGAIYNKITIDNTNNYNSYLGNITSNGEYYFVDDGTGKYIPTNGKTWQLENGGTSGVGNKTANSFVKVDLTNLNGTYVIYVNARVSSQSSYDIGYATITQNMTAPVYSTTSGRFMYIYGTASDKDYTSSILEGGKVYYLHLGYRKNGSTDTNEDQVVINSINLYPATEKQERYYFEFDNGKYISNNQEQDSTVANSYLPIDLREKTGEFELTVNAEISSASGDYGYATINQSQTAPQYNSNTTTNRRFIYITGFEVAKDYKIILEGGQLYYLHLGYYKNSSNSSGSDRFKINSIKIGNEEYISQIVKTDNNGKAGINLKVGTYDISEIEAPIRYDLNSDKNTITINRDSSSQTLNITNSKTSGIVIVHHYLKDSTVPVPMEDGTDAQDEIKENVIGEMYATKPLDDISHLFKNVGVTGQTSGEYVDGTIEVTYYYDYKDSTVTVHHYIEGTENSLSDDVVITGQITSHYETEVATDIPEYYELVEEPSNKEGTITYEPIEVIYEYKLKKYPYIVNYYKNGTTEKLADSKNGEEVTFGDSIKAEDEEISITGYKIVGYNTDELIIGTTDNVINIYYDIDETQTKDLSYTVEYYKDNVKVDSDTQTENTTVQVLQPNTMTVDKTKIDTVDKYVGYKLDTENTNIPDTIESGNVIKVYYIKDKFNYTVEYYYDGVIDAEKTDILQAKYQDEITTYTDKNIEGYKLDKTINLPLTITEIASQNIIKVYYERKDYKYTINYYYDNNLEESIELESKFGNIINDFTDKPKENYEFEKVENIPLTIGINEDENIINVYYRKKDSKLIVEYRDYETDEVILVNKVIDVKYGDEIVLDDYLEDIDDYTLVESPEPNRFVISEDEYTKTFYYAKNSNVVVKYLVKDDTPETNSDNTVLTYIDDDGNEKEYTYEILGYEGKDYSTEEKEIEGYTFVEATDNLSGKMKRETVEVIYYYLKNSKIIVNHIDRETDEVIDTEEIDGKVGDTITTYPKEFDGYELIKRPDEETITMTEDEITVNYYYAKISGGVIEKHIDIKTDEVLDMTKYKGNEGDRYITSEKEFEGYDLVEEKYPENKDGIMTIEPIEVKYYYIRKTSVKAEYIDYITGEVIPSKELTEDGKYVEKDSTEFIEGHEGDIYKTKEKEFDGYDLYMEKYPENKDGIMEVTIDSNGNVITETLVKFYYVHKSAGVIENHIDIKSNELLDTKTYEGHVGDEYKTKEQFFEGYDLVEEKYPENAEGEMEINQIVVNYYYIRKVIVVVEYIDELTQEPILEKAGDSTDEFTYYKDSTEYIKGHVGDEYKTKPKDFDRYKILEIPNNKDGKMEIISNQEQNNIQEIHVVYKYVREAEEVIEKHIDIFTGEELVDEKTYTGYEGDTYNTNKKEIDDYDLIEVPENAEGVMTDEKIEVKYYYARKTHLIVKYVDSDTGEEIERREIINGHQNDNYTTEAKQISSYKLLQDKYPENSNGKMLVDETYVTYYYQRVQENKKEKYVPEVLFVTSGGNTEKVQNTERIKSTNSTNSTNITPLKTNVISKNNNKVDISPNTGDNTPVNAISLSILVIVINIIQIIFSKHKKDKKFIR